MPPSHAHGQARRPGRGLSGAGAGGPPVAAGQGWPRRPPQREEREGSEEREREQWGAEGLLPPPSTTGHGLALPGRGQASPGRAARGARGTAPEAAPPDRGGHAGRPRRGEKERKKKRKRERGKKEKKEKGSPELAAGLGSPARW